MSIAYEREEGIARIRFDRPAKLNALTLAMYDELGHAFADAAADERVRVVILTGAGERAFCVGADLKERARLSDDGLRECLAEELRRLDADEIYKEALDALGEVERRAGTARGARAVRISGAARGTTVASRRRST